MAFQAGDWVRRKETDQEGSWTHGDKAVRVDELKSSDGSPGFYIAGDDSWWDARLFDLVSSFDPHALGMALVLADLVEIETMHEHWGGTCCCWHPKYRRGSVACWLRAEVQRELLSQVGAR